MAERLPDNPELAVDEVKRKARRRLVGAVVLALAAAVVLPLLLEKEPRPLGDEVSVRIPPIDEGRFVNRLSPKGADGTAAKAAPTPPPAAEPKPAPPPAAAPTAAPVPVPPTEGTPPAASAPPAKKNLADAEQRVLAPPAKTPAAAPATPDAKPKPAAPLPAPDAKAVPPGPAAAPVAPPPVAAAAPVTTDSTPSAQAPAKDGFVVQLAAFSDDKGANSLAGKLKRAGHAAYVEPVQTSHGTLWRVRVGGFATRAEADAARAKLKDAGHAGIVAPATKRAG